MFVIYTDKTPSGHGTDGYVLTFTRHQFDRVGNFQDYFWVAYPSGNEWNYLVSNICSVETDVLFVRSWNIQSGEGSNVRLTNSDVKFDFIGINLTWCTRN